uniref:Phosphatidylinositol glycan anchor biosynthesis class U protein n=1 Tax=Ciona intestinalis TaxID=7719 RepID=F6YMT8_CIOIN|nr:phosphatidylinositol glycan anchor biosynthesis class U protein [Ciona intestinalis]|eukprot:XP_002124479.1 phosphatidylinositol glycan anchor biosynthesis class U protein [Ciona intestinalis]
MTNLFVIISCGVLLRTWLLQLKDLTKWISKRPEVSTPQTSWSRLVEGFVISKQTGNVHSGDSYHGSTLLSAFLFHLQALSPLLVPAVFIACDVIAAISLHNFAKKFLQKELDDQNSHKSKLSKGVDSILLKLHHLENVPTLVALIYLFNPFTIVTCISQSSVAFNNLFLALYVAHLMSGSSIATTLFLALSTYETFYPVQLIIVAMLCQHKYQKEGNRNAAKPLFCFIFWLLILFLVSYLREGSLESIFSHYKFILTVPDQTPNIGIFWYFFTEIFNHFQTFFLFVFQINALFFFVPLSIKLRSHPICLMFILTCIISTFKSYPCVGDATLWISMLPLWSHTFKYQRQPLIVTVMLLTTTILCPVMWHMWIVAHSANANFYFAASLAYTTSHIFIMTNTVMAYLKWHYHIRKGVRLNLDGSTEKAVLRLMN